MSQPQMAAYAITNMKVDANNETLGTFNFGALAPFGSDQARLSSLTGSFSGTENVNIKLTYNNNGVPSANAYLDYIILKAKRNLAGYGRQFRFQYKVLKRQQELLNIKFQLQLVLTKFGILQIYIMYQK